MAQWWFILAAFVAGAVVWLALVRWWKRIAGRRRAKARWRRSSRGESRAESVLGSLGYAIESRQVHHVWAIEVDGERHEVQLRADLIASRDGERFVAEVKTGSDAPRVTNAATRRQLLEYSIAYDVDGVLLVNADTGDVREVVFDID